MMHRDVSHHARSRNRRCWLALAACAVAGTACSARSRTLESDSQAHWLRPCVQDAECGPLSCLCGTCSTPCSEAVDCEAGNGLVLTCTRPEPGSAACPDMAPGEAMCTGASSPAGASSPGSDAQHILQTSPTRIPSAAVPVPACPELAKTTGLPPFFVRTEMGDYDGIATVNRSTRADTVVLVPNAVVGQSIELTFNYPVPTFLPPGQRIQVLLRRQQPPGPDARYSLLVVRDEQGNLLLASHDGADRLYQDGL